MENQKIDVDVVNSKLEMLLKENMNLILYAVGVKILTDCEDNTVIFKSFLLDLACCNVFDSDFVNKFNDNIRLSNKNVS